MAKPSAVLSCVVVLLSIALIAIVVAGLVVFLDKYKDVNDLGIVSALALNGFFTPLLGVPILLLSLITLCCVAPEEPSQKGRRCLGVFWFLTAVICTAAILLSLLSFLINSILEVVFKSCKDEGPSVSSPTPSTPSPISTDCDEITNIGKYLSIATSVVCSIVAICAVVLCCFGCCFQEVDEDEHRGSVAVI